VTDRPDPLDPLVWPLSRIAEALGYLADRVGGRREQVSDSLPPLPLMAGQERWVGPWLESVAACLDLESLVVDATYGNVEQLLASAAPALLRLPGAGEAQFLVLLAGHARRVTLLSPDLGRVSVAAQAVANRLRAACETDANVSEPIERILNQAELRGQRRVTARTAMFRELHADRVLGNCWLIRPTAGARLRTLTREAGLGRLLGSVAVLHLVQYALWIAAWWLLGWMSVRGRFESGLFWAWMLLLLAMVPFRVLADAAGGTFAIRAGTQLKRRMLAGAFRLEAQEVRQWGVGQLLGRVIESEAVEALAVSGGFLAVTAVVELMLTVVVLGLGAGSWLHVALLMITTGIAAALGMRFYRRQLAWTEQRLDMTNDLVERMIGHRTRLAQQPPDQWNRGEDEALEHYLTLSRQMDRMAAALAALVPRGWLILGLLGLAPVFLTGGRSTVSLAVGLGGVVLAYQALHKLIDGGLRLASATIAWRRIQFLIEAARRREPLGRPHAELLGPVDGRPLVTARDVVFRYRGRGQPVLQGVDLTVCGGERLLLEGSSGGGKSTLASLLAGSRVPESGLLLLHGLDRETLGAANWRRRVVVAPQFHDNHVLMGPLAFNLLMGRRWPPTRADVEEAEQTCRELGLGPVLDRMPGGMTQMVGETGWQLSHGEKSRLFIARALLQRADMTILDESFAALDPQNLQRTLKYVLEQTPTVLVVAHP
jgi:ATP-binding cassette subfamily B protein